MLVDSFQSREFKGTLASYGFHNTVRVPAHITWDSSTLRNLFVITNLDCDRLAAGTILSNMSDRTQIFAFIDNAIYKHSDTTLILTQFINESLLQLFWRNILDVNWIAIYDRNLNLSQMLFGDDLKQ